MCPPQVAELTLSSALSRSGFPFPSKRQPRLGARLEKLLPHTRLQKIPEHLVTERPNHEAQTAGRRLQPRPSWNQQAWARNHQRNGSKAAGGTGLAGGVGKALPQLREGRRSPPAHLVWVEEGPRPWSPVPLPSCVAQCVCVTISLPPNGGDIYLHHGGYSEGGHQD